MAMESQFHGVLDILNIRALTRELLSGLLKLKLPSIALAFELEDVETVPPFLILLTTLDVFLVVFACVFLPLSMLSAVVNARCFASS